MPMHEDLILLYFRVTVINLNLICIISISKSLSLISQSGITHWLPFAILCSLLTVCLALPLFDCVLSPVSPGVCPSPYFSPIPTNSL